MPQQKKEEISENLFQQSTREAIKGDKEERDLEGHSLSVVVIRVSNSHS